MILLSLFLSTATLVAAYGEACQKGQAGTCQRTSTSCSTGYLSGFCPGGSDNKCCPTAAVANPVQNNNPVVASSYGACTGVAGQCQNANSQSCANGYLTNKCPGTPANIRCCPSAASGNTDNTGGVATPVISGSGGTFPVVDLSSVSVNWGGSRSSGSRCHAGIDLYTRGSGRVVAIAAGTVTAVMRGWYTCSGGSIDAILVYHTSGPVAGKTINYGEVSPGSYSVGQGSSVSAGQQLGTATRCGMLHMEQYSGRVTASQRWYPQGAIGNAYNGCATRWLSTKPAALQDPRPLVRSLMPAGATTRGGTSFLNDDADPSTFAEEENVADAPEDDASLSPGAIAACVIVGLILLACVVGLVTFFVLRRRTRAAELHVTNSVFAADAGTLMSARSERAATTAPTYAGTNASGAAAGSFVCQHCQKTYNYADDLSQHIALRHA